MLRKGLLCALLLPAAMGLAGEEETVARHVLALVQGSGPHPENEDVVHQLLELPLNHLGILVRRHYLDAGPPPEEALSDARAVLTYFTSEGKAPDWVWPWLEKEVRPRGLRVIHFGELTPLEAADPGRLVRWLRPFGLEYDALFVGGPYGIEVELRSPEACCYEADARFRASHRGPRNVDPRNRAWVATRARTVPGDVRTPVVTGPWGGLALAPWTVSEGGDSQDRRWHLDPFLFFREALGLERVPAPHPSVLNGRRMWFLQIDGDGFESLSTVRTGEYAAAVMLDEVLRRYRLPFTVSIIVRSLTDDYAAEEPTDRMRLAREILNLPHVEPASHGVLHTLRWQADPDSPVLRDALASYASLGNYEYGPVAEVRDSIGFINGRLLDAGRKCELMLWTGAANPLEDAIRAAQWNLNGGVFRWDQWHDSVGFVTPWSRCVGGAVQVYAGAANENDFDGFFDTMPGSFAHIDTTIERTGSPRILKPADIYIHFYSAERPARLKSVHDLIGRWALREPTAPVHASVYAKAVHSAVTTAKVIRTPTGWLLRDFGHCRTARIDGEDREVDFSRSYGLLGSRRIGDSLYLHLAEPDAEVVLSARPLRRPHVAEANCLLEEPRVDHEGVRVTATAWNPRMVRFAGFPPNACLRVRVGGEEREATSDARGEFLVELPGPGTTAIEVTLR